MGHQTPAEHELAELVVSSLNLENIAAADIDPDAALFGGDLGLDSIDALEFVVLIEENFGVSIPDETVAKQVLASIESRPRPEPKIGSVSTISSGAISSRRPATRSSLARWAISGLVMKFTRVRAWKRAL